jgi:hypothetical protein
MKKAAMTNTTKMTTTATHVGISVLITAPPSKLGLRHNRHQQSLGNAPQIEGIAGLVAIGCFEGLDMSVKEENVPSVVEVAFEPFRPGALISCIWPPTPAPTQTTFLRVKALPDSWFSAHGIWPTRQSPRHNAVAVHNPNCLRWGSGCCQLRVIAQFSSVSLTRARTASSGVS